ncbi:MAG: NTF2-like N-terminal transpeptidase domain-containing protein, partial [Nocardioides sp.]|nr:NTF2-like N-terminal transpeptidase domain-containing protein [Nocardioides sp.]
MRSRLAGLTALLLLLVGCDSAADPDQDDPAAPDSEVTALAGALASGDFTEVAFTEVTAAEVTAEHTEVVDGMGEVTPTVEAGDVEVDGDTATATLSWSWPILEEGAWTYDSQATLTRQDESWQVVWDRNVIEPSLRAATTLDLTPVRAPRGDVVGARGLKLVTPRPVVRIGIDRGAVPKARAADSARRLARLVGIDVAPYVKQVTAAGELAFVEAIVYRNDQLPPGVGQSVDRIPGARALADDLPLAPTREFAAPILGTVGEVTAEMIEAEPERYEVGDQAGLSGLQARYDEQLQGAPGAVVDAVGSDGVERELFRIDAEAGQPLELTLDPDLQIEAELLLADVAPSSALVAIRPSTGGIVAAANGPGAEGYNIATFGQFAPGSTFKSASALALLRAGLTPDSTVPCTSTIVVDGKRFKN